MDDAKKLGSFVVAGFGSPIPIRGLAPVWVLPPRVFTVHNTWSYCTPSFSWVASFELALDGSLNSSSMKLLTCQSLARFSVLPSA